MARKSSNNGALPAGEDPRPLHIRIRSELEGRVMTGAYPLGSLLPTEVELAREFDTSRFTIREALRYLHERGYVERRQGVGTRVISQRVRANYTLSVRSLEELFQVAHDTRLEILGEERLVLDGEAAEMLGGAAGEVWLRLDGLRWTEPRGEPLCFVQVHLPAAFEALLPEIRALRGPIFALVERHADGPIERTEQEICAMPMPPEMAERLSGRRDAWALRLLRRYVTRQGVIVASVNWHPAERMTYTMEIRRAARPD